MKQLQSHDGHWGSHPFPGSVLFQSFLGRGKMLVLEVWKKTDRDLEIFPQNLHGSCLSLHEQRIPFDVVIIWTLAMAQH